MNLLVSVATPGPPFESSLQPHSRNQIDKNIKRRRLQKSASIESRRVTHRWFYLVTVVSFDFHRTVLDVLRVAPSGTPGLRDFVESRVWTDCIRIYQKELEL